MKLGALELLNCLMCEDIRQDTLGKYILIGVTPGGFTADTLPGVMPVAIYFDFQPSKTGSHELYLRFSGPGENSAKMKLVLQVNDASEIATVATPVVQILMDREGDFALDISTDETRWKNLFRKTVTVRPLAPGVVPRFLPASST